MQRKGFIPVKQGQIYYESYGSGLPMVVLHGGPGLTMDYLFPHLLDLEQFGEIIFYDQRGTGQSSHCEISNDLVTIEQFIEDLEDIRKNLNLQEFILLGHSFGGFLAMQYALQHQKHLKGMILMSTLPANYEGMLAFAQEFNQRTMSCQQQLSAFEDIEQFNQLSVDEIQKIYQIIFSFYFYDPKQLNNLKLKFEDKSAKNGFYIEKQMSAQCLFKDNLNLFPSLSKLDIPCLVLHGEQDIIPLNTAIAIHENLTKSNMVVLQECDHFPFIEKKQETMRSIENFMQMIEKSC